ncbi:MAG: DUF5011 domain-containing protein [Bacteroidetes bacterium]|nr:DUF5011 domain-containing protein [Bacteroidota bacterium]
MKNKLILASLTIGMVVMIAACKKKNEVVSETVTVKYPVITLKGAKYVSIPVGGSFSDPGATLFDEFTNATTDLAPTQSAVDNTTPGMYPIIYEGQNKYGFKSQEVRWVAVTDISTNEDIGGLYKRTSNGQDVNITKVATGIYKVDNIGGVPGAPEYIYDMYFVQLSDTTLDFPSQPGPFGTTYTKSEKITKSSSDTLLEWAVMGAGFGTAVRKFSHQ